MCLVGGVGGVRWGRVSRFRRGGGWELIGGYGS